MGEEAFSGGTVLLQTCRRGPRPSFSSFPRAFVLTESLSPLAQAVFGMTTLQRYNAPKISLAAFFSFLKTDRLVQALFTPPVVLKPCFLFPALSPCRQTKKEGLARPFVHTTVPPPRSLPTSRKSWEGKGGGLEGGRGTFLQKGPLSPPLSLQRLLTLSNPPWRRSLFIGNAAFFWKSYSCCRGREDTPASPLFNL